MHAQAYAGLHYIQRGVYACVWRLSLTLCAVPRVPSTLDFETVSLIDLEPHHMGLASWLASPRDPPASASPVLGLQVCNVVSVWLFR